MGVNFIQPALPAMTQPFGIKDAALGLVMTALTGPAIFLAPLFGVVADLYGRRLLLAWGLILYGIFGAAMALAPTFTWLLVFRGLQGVAYSAVTPLTIVLIGDLLEGDKEIGGQGLKVFNRVGYMFLTPGRLLGHHCLALAVYSFFSNASKQAQRLLDAPGD
jgi:MFS family permease